MTWVRVLRRGGVQLPLGYIFEFDPTGITDAPDLSTADKVHDYFGYGTWEEYGSGRVTIGVGNGHEIGSEGGEESHKLTTGEMPSHSHKINHMSWGGKSLNSEINHNYNFWVFNKNNNAPIDISYLQAAGGDQPHNNMQPYRTVYRWRRIA